MLGIALTFQFKEMNSADHRFYDLQFFKENDSINLRNSKELMVQSDKIYSIRIITEFDQYAYVYDLICDELILKKSQLNDLGLEDGVQFEFFIEYNGNVSWNLKHSQLLKLNEITAGNPGISLNSIKLDWDDEFEAYEQALYHQIIFTSNEIQAHSAQIRGLWFEDFSDKYEGLLTWCFDTRKDGTKEFILSIKENVNQYNWNETFTDLLNFIDKQRKFMKKNSISSIYGFYQQNRNDMAGGEIGKEIIEILIRLELDLRITMNSNPPIENN